MSRITWEGLPLRQRARDYIADNFDPKDVPLGAEDDLVKVLSTLIIEVFNDVGKIIDNRLSDG